MNVLAVALESQGQGFASKLVRPFISQAEMESANVYVETMALSDVKIYEHYGFQQMEERHVKVGFSIWALYSTAKLLDE